MREPLPIAVAQPRCVPYDVAANAATHAAAVRSAGARVVIFPELSLTGYELDAPTIEPADPRLAPLVDACAETRALALVGAPVEGEAGQSHIAMLAVEGAGAAVAYRKIYLGAPEAERFSPGTRAGHPRGRRLAARSRHLQGHRHPRARGGHRRPGDRRLRRRHGEACARGGRPGRAPGASPRRTASGWRWRASPARPAAASTMRPAARASGRPTAP